MILDIQEVPLRYQAADTEERVSRCLGILLRKISLARVKLYGMGFSKGQTAAEIAIIAQRGVTKFSKRDSNQLATKHWLKRALAGRVPVNTLWHMIESFDVFIADVSQDEPEPIEEPKLKIESCPSNSKQNQAPQFMAMAAKLKLLRDEREIDLYRQIQEKSGLRREQREQMIMSLVRRESRRTGRIGAVTLI